MRVAHSLAGAATRLMSAAKAVAVQPLWHPTSSVAVRMLKPPRGPADAR